MLGCAPASCAAFAFSRDGCSAKLPARLHFLPMLEHTPLYGGNADFLDSLYEQYLRNPGSLEPRWREYFERLAGRGAAKSWWLLSESN